ncbi:MAG: Crp/Fnr family transcriptional regulator [Lysobacteraceae bacterium]|nr:MAG: Crp/Fnr family transcriptional regulator [Xanthomonadaceae bacterium]
MPLTREHNAGMERRRDAVARSAMFRGMPEALIDHVVACSIERRLDEGEVLFFKNDPGEFLGLVAQGRIYKILYGPKGQELILDTIETDDTVDEMALVDGSPRSFTAMAYGPVSALLIPRRHFQPLLENPLLMQRVHSLLHERFRRAVDSMEILCLHQLESRLARRMLSMMRGEAGARSGVVEVELPPTQSILAAMVNVSRPKLNAQLQEWRRTGMISCHRNIVRIHDVDALRGKAGLGRAHGASDEKSVPAPIRVRMSF